MAVLGPMVGAERELQLTGGEIGGDRRAVVGL